MRNRDNLDPLRTRESLHFSALLSIETAQKENLQINLEVSSFTLEAQTYIVLAPTYSRPIGLPSARRRLTAVFGMGTGVTIVEKAPRHCTFAVLNEQQLKIPNCVW